MPVPNEVSLTKMVLQNKESHNYHHPHDLTLICCPSLDVDISKITPLYIFVSPDYHINKIIIEGW